mmetsp:Transcript_2029/g.5145  ORF Transcript_2029/g.5145 Transcript_2029/m.5145 type:complete len:229 (-) Transcript_2029:1080-1766(-)
MLDVLQGHGALIKRQQAGWVGQGRSGGGSSGLLLLLALLHQGCGKVAEQGEGAVQLRQLCSRPAADDVWAGMHDLLQLGQEGPRLCDVLVRSAQQRAQLLGLEAELIGPEAVVLAVHAVQAQGGHVEHPLQQLLVQHVGLVKGVHNVGQGLLVEAASQLVDPGMVQLQPRRGCVQADDGLATDLHEEQLEVWVLAALITQHGGKAPHDVDHGLAGEALLSLHHASLQL